MSSPIQQRIMQVMAPVTDLEQSIELYGSLLGIRFKAERAKFGGIYWLTMGPDGCDLMLDSNITQPVTMLATHDIDAAYEYVLSCAFTPQTEIRRLAKAAYFTLAHPDGNVLMICQGEYKTPLPEQLALDEHPLLTRIGNVFVHVTDLAKSAAWYSMLFGIPLKDMQPESPVYWFTMDGHTGLLLDDNRNNKVSGCRPHCMFGAADIDEGYRFICGQGFRILRETERHPNVSFFTFQAPDGNVFMICS